MAEDASNQARGYKATLSNPNFSDEAKQHAQEMLDSGLKDAKVEAPMDQDKNPNNVAGGLKAAINNPGVSEEGKKAAQEKLDNL